MIIHAPEIKSRNGEVCVSARIELQAAAVNIPNVLWFKFPEGYEEYITDRADGFAVALLLLAMAHGEDIEVHGRLSPRLVYGMQEYQRIFHLWFPEQFKLIDIRCSSFEYQNDHYVNGGAACAFSGGVDSFYTLWSHLSQNELNSNYQVSYALFAHGFDIPLEDITTYRTARQAYEETMHKLGLQLLTASTNIRQFEDGTKINWDISHGSALISLALIMGRLFGRFYVPSSKTYVTLEPWGTDPLIDHLLSTETLEIVHDGASVTRFEKLRAIAQWSEMYSQLRVCWVKPDGLQNCCRCDKCIRTMTVLELLGPISAYVTFPLMLERQYIRDCKFLTPHQRTFARQIIEYAVTTGRKDITFDVRYALFRSRILSYAKWLKLKTKQITILRRLYQLVR